MIFCSSTIENNHSQVLCHYPSHESWMRQTEMKVLSGTGPNTAHINRACRKIGETVASSLKIELFDVVEK